MWQRIMRRLTGKPYLYGERLRVAEALKSALPDAPLIVEAGGHIGDDSLWMSRFWPAGSVHVFEPVPAVYQQLRNNTRERLNIHAYPLALNNKTGTAKIHISSGGSTASSSLLTPKDHLVDCPHVAFEEAIEVPTITLDLWAQQYGIKQIDFLWLDLQGNERAALEGARQLLPRVKAIHTEVSLNETYAGVELYPQFSSWLQSFGFKAVLENFEGKQGDVLFVKT